jgi:hypothetical protein
VDVVDHLHTNIWKVRFSIYFVEAAKSGQPTEKIEVAIPVTCSSMEGTKTK